MNPSFSSESLMEMFVFESNQLLEQLELSIIQGEDRSSFSPALIDEIMRTMHTIKGSAAMMGVTNMTELSHCLEDLFFYMREHKPPSVDCSAISDIVLEGCDFMKLELLKIRDGEEADGVAEQLIKLTGECLRKLKDGQVSQDYEGEKRSPGTFRVKLHFDEDCQMENVRAFAIIHQLQELAEEVVYSPADIKENEASAHVIRQEGFTIWLQTERSEEELRKLLDGTVYVNSIAVEAWEDESQWTPLMKSCFRSKAAEDTAPPAAEERWGNGEQEYAFSSKQSMISVQVGKLDRLMDLVGELVISEAMVTRNPELEGLQLNQFSKAARQLRKITGEIQDMVMSIRMVPLTTTFQKLRRVVRDMSKKMGKEIRIETIGEDTEVDKNMIEQISDPLIHLIRNAADHGIEGPEERVLRQKNRAGTITLEAMHIGNEVQVTLRDDGRGLNRAGIVERAKQNGILPKPEEEMTDQEVFGLVFLPGFSTKTEVTEFSGRGVGMDVVTRNIESLGGTVVIDSQPGEGTVITLRIPLTLAIIEGMNIRVGQSRFTLPIRAIRESFRAKENDVILDPDGAEMLLVRGQCYPILRLHKRYGLDHAATLIHEGIIVMVEHDRRMVCVFADELLGEQQVVVKGLPEYIKRTRDIRGIGGCTLLGDGSISLILDVPGLMLL